MNAIVAVDCNWGIGANNNLLARIPEDMIRFKKLTKGHQVIMGRKTFESLPGGRPLPNRTNIVLTSRNFISNEVVCKSNIADVVRMSDSQSFVIGGKTISQFLDFCDKVFVTMIYKSYNADTFFPNLDRMLAWEAIEQSELKLHAGVHYRFITYARKSP